MNSFGNNNFYITPIVKNILIINVLMLFISVLLFSTKGLLVADYLALHPLHSMQPNGSGTLFKPWQIITHMFMHGGDYRSAEAYLISGFGHLFTNALGLFFFGTQLETIWGSKRFLNFYLICGAGAALIYLGVAYYQDKVLLAAANDFIANPTYDQLERFITRNINGGIQYFNASTALLDLKSTWAEDAQNTIYAEQSIEIIKAGLLPSVFNQGCVGASGAIFGILGACAYLFPNQYLMINLIIPLKLKFAIPLYAIYEVYRMINFLPGDNVAHLAHLAGLVVGLIFVIIINKTNRKTFY